MWASFQSCPQMSREALESNCFGGGIVSEEGVLEDTKEDVLEEG